MTITDPWADVREPVTAARPVAALAKLGMTTTAPLWWRDVETERRDGRTIHTVKPSFLNARDTQQLAALTFEGFDIRIHARRDHVRVQITEQDR